MKYSLRLCTVVLVLLVVLRLFMSWFSNTLYVSRAQCHRDIPLISGKLNERSSILPQNTTTSRLTKDKINSIMADGVDPTSLRPLRAYLLHCNIEAWSTYVFREHYYIFDGLFRTYNWKPINMQELMDAVDEKNGTLVPEVVMVWSLIGNYDFLKKARAKGVKFAFYQEDMQKLGGKDPEALRKFLSLTDYIVAAYGYHIKDYFAPLKVNPMPKVIWLPHAAGPEYRHLKVNNNPKRHILVPGASKKYCYPMRAWAIEESKRNSNIEVLPHRGYKKHYAMAQSIDFGQHLHKYQAIFTSTSLFHYMVAKIFEIPASGSLLVVNKDIDDLLMALGCYPKIHYISYDNMHPEETIAYLDNPENYEEIDRIRRRGYAMVHANHYIAHRVYSLHAFFSDGIETYKIPKQYKPHSCPSQYNSDLDECVAYTKTLNVYPLKAAGQ